LPKGCVFQTRCKYVKERCRAEEPQLRPLGENHFMSCHFAEELDLQGITLLSARPAGVVGGN
jgi:ABC-type antimicrobial peptide transport system ATPase subunit